MTDAELAALKPGDRIRNPVTNTEYTVTLIDRRRIFLDNQRDIDIYALDSWEVVPQLLVEAPADDPAFRLLESRWRALTDEVLVALKRLVAERGCSLDAFAVQFSVDGDGVQAGIWRLDLDGGVNVPENPMAICSVGTMLGKASNVP